MSDGAGPGLFELLDAQMLDQIRQLELFSRFRVEGSLQGLNKSPFKGHTTDFRQHRQYHPGDNLKHLDWRVFGKSDRLVVREYEEQTNACLNLVVDISGSMSHQGASLSKLDFSIRAAAILLYLALVHRDVFALTTFRTDRVDFIPLGGGRTHLRRAFALLLGARAEGGTDFARSLQNCTAAVRRRGLTVMLSDFMDDPEKIVKLLARLRFRGSDVVAMQVFDPTERELDFNTITRFHDPESEEVLVVDPQLIQQQYRRAFEAHIAELRDRCRQFGFEHVALPVQEKWEVPVLEYVNWRRERFA